MVFALNGLSEAHDTRNVKSARPIVWDALLAIFSNPFIVIGKLHRVAGVRTRTVCCCGLAYMAAIICTSLIKGWMSWTYFLKNPDKLTPSATFVELMAEAGMEFLKANMTRLGFFFSAYVFHACGLNAFFVFLALIRDIFVYFSQGFAFYVMYQAMADGFALSDAVDEPEDDRMMAIIAKTLPSLYAAMSGMSRLYCLMVEIFAFYSFCAILMAVDCVPYFLAALALGKPVSPAMIQRFLSYFVGGIIAYGAVTIWSYNTVNHKLRQQASSRVDS